MDYENDLPQENQVPDYLIRTLQMMRPYTLENDHSFYPWLDYFEYVTNMIGIPNEKMVEIFNNMIDEGVHRIVKAFSHPVNLSNLSYDSLINHYIYYFHRIEPPKMRLIRFISRDQFETEPIERYANNLLKLHEQCNRSCVKDPIFYNKFMKGLNDDLLRTYIIRNTFLSFKETQKKIISISKTLNKHNCECHISPIIDTYYHGNPDLFCEWLNRFEYLRDIYRTPRDKMLEHFHKSIDINFKIQVRRYYEEINFSQLSYENTVELYLGYYLQFSESNLYRRRFYYRTQYEDESIEGYVARLRKIYDKCDFNDIIEERLSEQFVNGIFDDDIKKYFKRFYGLPFIDVLSFAIKCDRNAAAINYEEPDLSIIDFYNSENEGTFWDWFNKFEYTVKNLKLGNLTVLEVFNKKIHSDIQKKVKNANPNIDFSEILYEDTIRLYLRYFASADETDVYRKLFLCRNQYKEEKITEYADDLYDIFVKCNFTGNSEKILIKKFINGIYDNKMKNIYERFPTLNYRQLINLTQSLGRFQKFNSYLSIKNAKLKSFHPDHGEEFYVWFNKFEYIASMLDLKGINLIKFFNSMIDDYVHKLVKDANSDIELTDLQSDELINCYLRFYASPNETHLHLKRFFCRNQYEKESIGKYSRTLISIRNKCKDFYMSHESLCERFREGLFDDNVRLNLNEFHGITYTVLVAKALQIANETYNQHVNILLDD